MFFFGNDGASELYLASADWMERNFFRRVEIAFPVREQTHRDRILRDLKLYLADNTQAWTLGRDGSYTRCERGDDRSRDAQAALLARYAAGSAPVSVPDGRYFAVNTRRRNPTRLQVLDLGLQVRDRQRMIVEPVGRKAQLQRVRARVVSLMSGSATLLRPRCSSTASRSSSVIGGARLSQGGASSSGFFDRRLAAVAADHDGQQFLLFAREAGHVGVRQ